MNLVSIFFFTEYEDVSQGIEEKKITSSKIPEIESKSNSNTFEFEILYLFVKNMNSALGSWQIISDLSFSLFILKIIKLRWWDENKKCTANYIRQIFTLVLSAHMPVSTSLVKLLFIFLGRFTKYLSVHKMNNYR